MAVTRVKIAFGDGPLVVSPTWTDLAALDGVTVQQWSIERGRRDELSKTGTGSATVHLIDREGVLDPTNGASPVFPDVLPDRQILIELYDPVQSEWQTRFRGHVESFDFTLAEVTESHFRVTIEAVDGFGFLNDHELEPGVAGDTLTADVAEGNVFYEDGNVDDRILAILADVGWPSGLYEIFSGNVSVQETIYSPGTEALAALFDAADAEFPGVANVYCDREGIVTFHGRQARFRPDVAGYGIRRQDVGDFSATDSDATVCPIAEMSFDLGKTMIYNSVLAYPQGIADDDIAGQLVEDATSITAHGKKSLSFTDLLTAEGLATGNTANEETVAMATYYRDNYKDPLPRIRRMVFKSRMPDDRLAGPVWKMMCRSDISDLLTVVTGHPGGGGFGDEGYYIEGLRQTCRPANPDVPYVELEVDVSPQALFDFNPFDSDPDPS